MKGSDCLDKKVSITDAELKVAEILWQAKEPLSAYQIRQRLNTDNKWERTTVLTLIKRLLEKEIIGQEKKEIYYYKAIINEDEYVKEETKQFVERLYKGNAKNLVAALVQEQGMTQEDIEELKNYFNT